MRIKRGIDSPLTFAAHSTGLVHRMRACRVIRARRVRGVGDPARPARGPAVHEDRTEERSCSPAARGDRTHDPAALHA